VIGYDGMLRFECTPMNDPFDLQRFVDAQAPVIDTVLAELTRGRKEGHWIWFIFPQLRALGRSPTAIHFGLVSLDAARAYLAHPILKPRLIECARTVTGTIESGRSLHEVLGSPDDLKFRSSMTLFERAAHGSATVGPVFGNALDHCCGGERDALTIALLA
jgi:uncharacterized protein (DUF1810 family)